MSLIYQALKQSEQHASASATPVVRQTAVALEAGRSASPYTRNRLGLGAALAFGGVLVGYLLTTGNPAPSAQASQDARSQTPTAAPLSDTTQQPADATPSLDSLPKADLPLPTASPRLRMDLTLPQAPKKPSAAAPASAPTPTPAATPVSKSSAAAVPALASVTPAVVSIDPSPKPIVATTSSAPAEDVGRLFEAMNAALANGDVALAQKKLLGIQAGLNESSVARLRAEAWFAHQTGELDKASRVYRQLLEKIPGDEFTSVNLASIEKKRLRPEQAKEVLTKALRQNPTSNVLRSAAEQLAQAEARQ